MYGSDLCRKAFGLAGRVLQPSVGFVAIAPVPTSHAFGGRSLKALERHIGVSHHPCKASRREKATISRGIAHWDCAKPCNPQNADRCAMQIITMYYYV
jgi:hypothetical protein